MKIWLIVLAGWLVLQATDSFAVDWPYNYVPPTVLNCAALKPHDHRGSVRTCAGIQETYKVWYGVGNHWVWVPKSNRPGGGWQDAESKLHKLNAQCRTITRKLNRGKIKSNRRNLKRQARRCS